MRVRMVAALSRHFSLGPQMVPAKRKAVFLQRNNQSHRRAHYQSLNGESVADELVIYGKTRANRFLMSRVALIAHGKRQGPWP